MSELINPQNGIQPIHLVQQLMQRPDFTTDMLRDLLDMMKEQEHRADLRTFRATFARCQAQVTKADRDKSNPVFRSRYASIEAMYDAVWPAVTEAGFTWIVSALPQAPEGWDNTVLWFQGRLSMGIITETVELPVSKGALAPEGAKGNRAAMTPTQALGSLTTYMRKYLLGLMFNIVTAEDVRFDNDGNRDLPPDAPREAINRNVPMPATPGSLQAPPAGNGRDPWDLWLETLDSEAAKVTEATWDGFWSRNTVKRAFGGLQGEQLARLEAIQQRHRDRLFPAPPTDDAA